ncbi:putative GDP-mannose transporter 2 [Dictyocoela muelleri]|nr:putative GDP-mannose transporter 2 [Dictyocoela muelleri]
MINKILMIQENNKSPFFILVSQSSFVVFILFVFKGFIFINRKFKKYKIKKKIIEYNDHLKDDDKDEYNDYLKDDDKDEYNDYLKDDDKYNFNDNNFKDDDKYNFDYNFKDDDKYNFDDNFKRRLKSFFLWNMTSLFLVIMIYSSLESFKNLEISTFIMLKNFSIITTAFLELYIFNKKIGLNNFFAFILIIIGSTNLHPSNSLKGYFYVLTNILSTSLFTISMRYIVLTEKTTDIDSLMISQTLTIPYLLILSVFFDHEYKMISINMLLLSCIAVFLVAYSSIWCMRVLSSTSYCVVGSLNKLLLSLSGILFFDETISLLKFFSIVCGSFSGLLYSKTILKE